MDAWQRGMVDRSIDTPRRRCLLAFSCARDLRIDCLLARRQNGNARELHKQYPLACGSSAGRLDLPCVTIANSLLGLVFQYSVLTCVLTLAADPQLPNVGCAPRSMAATSGVQLNSSLLGRAPVPNATLAWPLVNTTAAGARARCACACGAACSLEGSCSCCESLCAAARTRRFDAPPPRLALFDASRGPRPLPPLAPVDMGFLTSSVPIAGPLIDKFTSPPWVFVSRRPRHADTGSDLPQPGHGARVGCAVSSNGH